MGKVALFCLVLSSSAALSTVALAVHASEVHAAPRHHHHTLAASGYLAAAPTESWTSIGTPDCHTQGRLFRVAHHCPPAAVAAAPPVTHENPPRGQHYFSRW